MRPVVAGVAVAVVVLLAAGCSPWAGFEQVPAGGPGAAGPCTPSRREVPDPLDPQRPAVLVEPTGAGSPWTGGTCGDASRPLAVVVHGFGGGEDSIYGGLVQHLVGAGFVVVFPRYADTVDLDAHQASVDASLVAAVAASGRVDTSRVGVVGHSMGGGMAPWVLRQAVGRGWGSSATWLVAMAPWFAWGLPAGPVEVPARTRAAVVAYDRDDVVDARIGMELLRSLTVAPDHRVHVVVRSDLSRAPMVVADHYTPVSFLRGDLGGLSEDHLDRWSSYRTVDATAGCALDGRWCDTDLSHVGARPDGTRLPAAIVTRDGVDAGPPAAYECTSPLDPRPCPAG